jgi:hypothetical protein
VDPVSRRTVVDLLDQQQLRSVQVADDRDIGCDPCGGLVKRREVVQQQHVEGTGLGLAEGLLPGGDVRAILGVADQGEAAVLCVRPIFIGRMHRRLARREVHGVDIEAAIKRLRVTRPSGQRAAQDPNVPSVLR